MAAEGSGQGTTWTVFAACSLWNHNDFLFGDLGKLVPIVQLQGVARRLSVDPSRSATRLVD